MSELPVTWNLESFFNSSLPKNFEPRQGIYDSVHGWPWRHTDKWISIEEVESAWFHMFGSKNLPEDAIPRARFDVAKFQEMSPDLPFPCSETNCSTFHSNRHGFCHKHRFHRFGRKLSSAVLRALGWLELVLLLTIQAAAEIQSRFLLLVILVSLLPVTCIFLEESTGMSAASICITFLVVSVGTCLYTAKRLDGMQQSVFNMALATEARYFQVLQPTSETSDNLVQVSTILRNHSDGSSEEMPPTQQDLKTKYQLAQNHMNLFQTVVCEPLASTGVEVISKINPLTELDEREGGADILFCEVWCDNLQEVQDAWDMLKDLDGVEIVSARDFFAVASYKKICEIVVSLQGYWATVVLMEKTLSSWEAQKGLSDAADSLGLLDKTKASAWEVSRLQRDSEVPRCVFVATAFLRLVALVSCYIIGGQIGHVNSWDPFFGSYCCYLIFLDPELYEHECGNGVPRMLAMNVPFLTCFLILLWEILCCCCCCFCFCKRRQSFKIRPRPTQLWYRKYLGVQGCHYALKVAALQFLTVMTQGLAKTSLFRTIQDTHGSEALRASTAVHCFIVLLLCNILFPAMILVMPNYVFSRVGAALLDAVLDVGYMVTSIWLYWSFAAMSLTDIFLSSFLNYMSIYICVAHVLCVCRSLETADWVALFQVPRAAPTCKAWKRILFSTAYVAFVSILLGGIVLGAFTSHDGLCPPCQCSAVAPTSLLLERCVIPIGYVAQGAPDMLEFNLTNRNIAEVLPDAFIARGEHQKVRSVSLRGNRLTELPEGLFRDLLQQEDADELFSDPDIDTLDLADNRIVALPPGVFQADSSGGLSVIRKLHLEGNCLTTLPPGVFHGLTFGQCGSTCKSHSQQVLHAEHAKAFHGLPVAYKDILDMSQNKLQTLHAQTFHGLNFRLNGILNMSWNKLQVLHAKAFHGLTFDENGILDMSQNKLKVLHADAFRGLTFGYYGILDMSQNKLEVLHADAFHDLKFGRSGILDMSQNKLKTLPPKVFEGLDLDRLHLQHNELLQLHAETFHGVTFGHNRILDMSQNKLQELLPKIFDGLELNRLYLQNNNLVHLHAEAFQGLTFAHKGILDMSQNKLQDLPPNVFAGTRLEILDLAENELSMLPNEVFHGLTSLRSLKLEGNRLRSLGTRLFYLIRLEELNLEQNQLSDLDEDVFASGFYSTCNPAGCVYRSLKRRLLKLNLGCNQLTTLPNDLFNGFRTLRNLQLQSNLLARLPQQLFQSLGEVHCAFLELLKEYGSV